MSEDRKFIPLPEGAIEKASQLISDIRGLCQEIDDGVSLFACAYIASYMSNAAAGETRAMALAWIEAGIERGEVDAIPSMISNRKKMN